MRVKWYLLCIFILLVSNINIVNAEECDTNYILEMKELANNISYEQEYIGGVDDPQLYRITFSNIDSRLYIEYLAHSNDDLLISNENDSIEVSSGHNIFKVYSSKCSSALLSINVDLPKYNEFSSNDSCNGDAKKLDICDEWYQGNLTEEKFQQLISEYENSNENVYSRENIKDFVMNNIYYFVGGILLLLMLIFGFIYIKRRNSYLR